MADPISFVNILAQYADLTGVLHLAISDAIRKGDFTGGTAVTSFEEELAEYCGVEHVIGCSSGTSALKLALLGMGLEPGDHVVVPTNSFIASASAVVHAAGIPVFVDCDPHTYLMDMAGLEGILQHGSIRFIMPVHLYGNPCPMDAILELAVKYEVSVLEDNAQALGAYYRGERTGSFGQAACVSFFPSKNLGAFGQAGAVLTNDPRVAEIARMYREHGQGTDRYKHQVFGYNDRLDSVQARVLRVLLPKLDELNQKRRQVACWYRKRLPENRLQVCTPGSTHTYHLLPLRCDDTVQREQLITRLRSEEIGFGLHYPIPIHLQPAWNFPMPRHNTRPVAERLAKCLISLPMHPTMTEDQVIRVCDVVREELGW